LGEEQLCLFDRTQVDWEQQGLPDGPITVGIDGGYVRAAHAIFIFLTVLVYTTGSLAIASARSKLNNGC
jgi:hypothetical protein